MPRRSPRRRRALAALTAAAALSAGCAATRDLLPVADPVEVAARPAPGSAPEAPPEPAEPDPLPGHLDQRLADLERRYLEGVQLIVEGREVAGEARLAAATVGLREVRELCAGVAGCDPRKILALQERLLETQSIELKKQAAAIRDLEAEAVALAEPEREPGTMPFVEPLPERDPGASLLRGTDLRSIINLNGPVRAALDDWLTWRRPHLVEALEHYRDLRVEMATAFEDAGLPEALLFAVMATESGGKVHAYSRAGAAGPLQFMRHTGRRYGLHPRGDFDTRLEPAAASRAAAAYLGDLLEQFDGDLAKALASYNAGEGRIRRLERRAGGASLWERELFYALPSETRQYVPRVLAAAWLFLHPDDYGLTGGPPPARPFTTLKLRQAIALGELAVCLGTASDRSEGWFRTLRNLNPQLDPGERIAAGESIRLPQELIEAYEARCLDGELLARARELHDANYPDPAEMRDYVVRRGDSLGRIASRFPCVSMAELAAVNRIRPPRYVIHPGQLLQIPSCE